MRDGSPVDLESILARGGLGRIQLLSHCVKSITLEPMFLVLAGEYAFRPTIVGAIALYDVFCATNGDAVVKAPSTPPPHDLRLSAAIANLRLYSQQSQSTDTESDIPVRTVAPSRNLFDNLVVAVRNDADGPVAALARHYDPGLSPVENLPGGTMTAGQRRFIEMIWRPRLRPRLVDAGFWQISTIE